MSLADELLADLEEAEEEEEAEAEGSEGGEEPPIEDVRDEPRTPEGSESVRSIAKLWGSRAFVEIMQKDREYINKQPKAAEGGPEYRVIVDANNLTVEIENELSEPRQGILGYIIHKFIRDKYSKRFPELESLVPNALDYIRTVKELGNSLDKCKNNENVQQILTNATIMVVSVTASTTQGQQLSEEELSRIEDACDMALALSGAKLRIYEYVESRMSFIAPNLSLILGASTAAKIMGVAGGLTPLSKLPACNILLLGAQRRTLSGFSSTSVLPHTGFIYHSDIVQSLPPDLRRKAARLVAAKCTLAARVDSFHESQDGKVGYEAEGGDRRKFDKWGARLKEEIERKFDKWEYELKEEIERGVGYELKEEIERKFDKWQEPPPVKQVKPLPAPLDGQRKKRGGRRYRKMKERLGLTEIRKQANRMSFGEIEEDAYQEDLGFSLGHLGKAGSGRVRQTQVNEATKARISKTLQRTLQKQSVVYGGKSTIRDRSSGTASSVAFTPLQLGGSSNRSAPFR
ncbi:U4/U6 small nuclear ribonucleoprotein Prp31-like [Myiozetetes cayanensis]|uniref:U4/U6 small nuclear ribonucleoprotein Prp31-like n=1 Tax=Myiozetetes cayanensis TaxID=478635 RepID=UPI00215F9C47|nr:U4/U6 small nuclear ribonucleoprotein Prp31-like [Myiozetetes cayanensis]